MRKTIILTILCVTLLFCTATQCQKEEPKLPPETQIGANTFGCYVNDELFLPSRHIPGHIVVTSGLKAGYNLETNLFAIECITSTPNNTMFFIVNNPQENEYLSFSLLEFRFRSICFESDSGNICYEPHNVGRVFFTKFDTVNNIASGRFEFSGQCAPCINGEIREVQKTQIASGRFDVKFGGQFWR